MVLLLSVQKKAEKAHAFSALCSVLLQHELVIHKAAQGHCRTDDGRDRRHPADQRFGHAVAVILLLVLVQQAPAVPHRCAAGGLRDHAGALVRLLLPGNRARVVRHPAHGCAPRHPAARGRCGSAFRAAGCAHHRVGSSASGCCAHDAGRLFRCGGLRRNFGSAWAGCFRLQQRVQRVLQQDAVAAALRAVDGIFLLRVEGTAGAVPAVLNTWG